MSNNPDGGSHASNYYEFRIRVDAPIDEIADLLLQAGYEPTPERLGVLLQEMQANCFDDKDGGCPASVVEDYILSRAALSIDDLVENDGFEEE